MAGLCDLVEVLENNMECVVLEVKDGVQKELVCLGCLTAMNHAQADKRG